MSATTFLLTVYCSAAVSELVGIAVTVTTYLREDPEREGLFIVQQAETRW